MSAYQGRDDGAYRGRIQGIPTSRTQAAQVPVTATSRVTLPGTGITVLKTRYESFADELKRFGQYIATNPNDVPRTVENLGRRLMQWHIQEMADYQKQVMTEANKPANQRFDAYRATMRAQLQKDPQIGGQRHGETVARSKAVVAQYASETSEDAKTEFLDMADALGAGDSPAMHRFLQWVGTKLKLNLAGTPYAAGGSVSGGKAGKMYGPKSAPAKAATPAKPAPQAAKAAAPANGTQPRPAGAPSKARVRRSASSRLYGG